ncbi:hypothetical protein H9P43_006284 [Blastocladiella emersonii ATCC 22665]|nr:hypothetical protein H9P43_006284 [Blastocladiella emersonii ATCC 22665]
MTDQTFTFGPDELTRNNVDPLAENLTAEQFRRRLKFSFGEHLDGFLASRELVYSLTTTTLDDALSEASAGKANKEKRDQSWCNEHMTLDFVCPLCDERSLQFVRKSYKSELRSALVSHMGTHGLLREQFLCPGRTHATEGQRKIGDTTPILAQSLAQRFIEMVLGDVPVAAELDFDFDLDEELEPEPEPRPDSTATPFAVAAVVADGYNSTGSVEHPLIAASSPPIEPLELDLFADSSDLIVDDQITRILAEAAATTSVTDTPLRPNEVVQVDNFARLAATTMPNEAYLAYLLSE